MKLRIQDDSLRFRLNRRDVGEFLQCGSVSASVHFGATELRYSLVSNSHVAVPEAQYGSNEIRVELPEQSARDWALSETVGMEVRQAFADSGSLHILIEKDFQCMHRDQALEDPDAYPNPQAAA